MFSISAQLTIVIDSQCSQNCSIPHCYCVQFISPCLAPHVIACCYFVVTRCLLIVVIFCCLFIVIRCSLPFIRCFYSANHPNVTSFRSLSFVLSSHEKSDVQQSLTARTTLFVTSTLLIHTQSIAIPEQTIVSLEFKNCSIAQGVTPLDKD